MNGKWIIDLTKIADFRPCIETTEASTLGWKPGMWPSILEYEGVEFKREKMNYRPSNGELIDVTYGNQYATVTVYND